jgi:hypothetical protein
MFRWLRIALVAGAGHQAGRAKGSFKERTAFAPVGVALLLGIQTLAHHGGALAPAPPMVCLVAKWNLVSVVALLHRTDRGLNQE